MVVLSSESLPHRPFDRQRRRPENTVKDRHIIADGSIIAYKLTAPQVDLSTLDFCNQERQLGNDNFDDPRIANSVRDAGIQLNSDVNSRWNLVEAKGALGCPHRSSMLATTSVMPSARTIPGLIARATHCCACATPLPMNSRHSTARVLNTAL